MDLSHDTPDQPPLLLQSTLRHYVRHHRRTNACHFECSIFFFEDDCMFLKRFTDINFSSISTATSAVEFGFESRRDKIKDAVRARHFDDTRQLSHAKFDI